MALNGLQGGLTPPQIQGQLQTPDIYKALLARMGASALPQGFNGELDKPSTFNKAEATPAEAIMPRLKGAPAQPFNGGAGGSGLAAGIGNALMNMYNSRMAQSANEVAQAQADKAAQDLAARQEAQQAAIYKREEDKWNREEAARKADPNYALDLRIKSARAEFEERKLAQLPKDGGGGGTSGNGASLISADGGPTQRGVAAIRAAERRFDPDKGIVVEDKTPTKLKAQKDDPNAVHALWLDQRSEAAVTTKEDQKLAKEIQHTTQQYEKEFEKYKLNKKLKPDAASVHADTARQLKDRLKQYEGQSQPPLSQPANQNLNIPLSAVQYDEQGNAYIEQ